MMMKRHKTKVQSI